MLTKNHKDINSIKEQNKNDGPYFITVSLVFPILMGFLFSTYLTSTSYSNFEKWAVIGSFGAFILNSVFYLYGLLREVVIDSTFGKLTSFIFMILIGILAWVAINNYTLWVLMVAGAAALITLKNLHLFRLIKKKYPVGYPLKDEIWTWFKWSATYLACSLALGAICYFVLSLPDNIGLVDVSTIPPTVIKELVWVPFIGKISVGMIKDVTSMIMLVICGIPPIRNIVFVLWASESNRAKRIRAEINEFLIAKHTEFPDP